MISSERSRSEALWNIPFANMQILTDFEGFEIFISDIHDGDALEGHFFPEMVQPENQIHSDSIQRITREDVNIRPKDVDGLLTREYDLPIGVRCADCPVIILMGSDECAAIHSGWRGTQLHIGQKAVAMMITRREEIRAYIWPHIQGYSYEVQSEFLEYFPSEYFERKDEKIFFDIGKYIIDDLVAIWLKTENIIMSSIDTCSNPSYHSYRRDRASGRGIVGVRMK